MAIPIVLTKENVLAAMDGRKTMTRRIIKPQPPEQWNMCDPIKNDNGDIITFWFYDSSNKYDYGYKDAKYQVGDEVYVAEGYQITQENIDVRVHGLFYVSHHVKYLADGEAAEVTLNSKEYKLWKARKHPYRPTSGRFMYKSLARTFMKITEVKVERLQSISNEDVKAEGVIVRNIGETPYRAFQALWNSIHGKNSWNENPYVWVYRWE